jgi:hypothetical protein
LSVTHCFWGCLGAVCSMKLMLCLVHHHLCQAQQEMGFFFFFCYYYVNHIGFLELEVLKVIFLTIAVNQIARGFGISQF